MWLSVAKFVFSPWFNWLIFVSALLVVVALHFLGKNYKNTLRRQKSREIAEKAAKAGDRFRNHERVAVDPSAVEGLDQEELKQLTEEFERLGFVRALDYRLKLADQPGLQSFGRAMVQPASFCSGEIMATQKQLDAKEPLIFGLTSHLEKDWRIGSINRSASKVDYFQRLPKSIRLMRRGATPEQLLRRHIELRGQVSTDLGLQVLTDLSLETKFRLTQELLAERRETLLKCDILAEMADARSVAEQEEWEWLGDYPLEKVRRLSGERLRVIPDKFPTYEIPQSDALERLNAPPSDARKTDSKG